MTKSSVKSHREWEQQRKRGKTNKRVVESGDGDTFYIKVYWDFKWDENRISFRFILGLESSSFINRSTLLKVQGKKIYLKKLSSSVIHSQTINRQCQLGLHLIPQSLDPCICLSWDKHQHNAWRLISGWPGTNQALVDEPDKSETDLISFSFYH